MQIIRATTVCKQVSLGCMRESFRILVSLLSLKGMWAFLSPSAEIHFPRVERLKLIEVCSNFLIS